MTKPFGYNGRLLRVDLATRTISFEERDDIWWRTYAGGGLLATELLLRETPPGIDAFDPGNLLVVASSVTAGHPYAGLARFSVAGKSPPYPGHWRGAQRRAIRHRAQTQWRRRDRVPWPGFRTGDAGNRQRFGLLEPLATCGVNPPAQ
ncbi:MAG: aldehyde ferredoxin oxidoreductase N-terminal domain-containing protein [Thermomicrobiales bacterium]